MIWEVVEGLEGYLLGADGGVDVEDAVGDVAGDAMAFEGIGDSFCHGILSLCEADFVAFFSATLEGIGMGIVAAGASVGSHVVFVAETLGVVPVIAV